MEPTGYTGDLIGIWRIQTSYLLFASRVGPTLGAILAAGLHQILHLVHYWELNPGADAVSHD